MVNGWMERSVLTSRYPPHPLTSRTGDAVSAREFNIWKLRHIMFIVLNGRFGFFRQVLLVLFLLQQGKQRLPHGWACLQRKKSTVKFSELECKSWKYAVVNLNIYLSCDKIWHCRLFYNVIHSVYKIYIMLMSYDVINIFSLSTTKQYFVSIPQPGKPA